MAKRIKTASPYFLILVLVGLLIGFNFWTSKIEAGYTTDTTVQVGNSEPEVSSVSFADGDNINLTENDVISVVVRAFVTDSNGCEDIWDGLSKGYIYRSGVTASCSSDLDDCYLVASCSTDATRNDCTGGADTDLIMTCSVDLQYFAEATGPTASPSFAAQQWYGAVWSSDETGDDDIASNSTQTTDIILLRALEASTSINYQSISPGGDSEGNPREAGLENTGNSGMDPKIEASTTLVCTTAGTCGSETIDDDNQKYASESWDYSDEYNVALTGSPVQYDLNLPAPDSDTYPVDDQVFWGLGVDGGQSPGTYEGVITFSAVGD